MSIVVPDAAGGDLTRRLRADAHQLGRTTLLGACLGVVMLGIVGRLAMFALAEANPDAAGLLTDDGFVIDRFTLAGSLQLAATGAVFGALSGVLYTALAPLRIGPQWFRRLSFSVGAGTVVSSQVIHSDGLDFVVLDRPAALAVLAFLLIPVLHVLALDLAVERTRSDGPRLGWAAAGLVLALPFLPIVAPLAAGRAAWSGAVTRWPDAAWLHSPAWAWLVRAGLTVVFVLAAADILSDLRVLF